MADPVHLREELLGEGFLTITCRLLHDLEGGRWPRLLPEAS